MTECVCAVDIGTTSLKVGLISLDGDLISLSSAKNITTDAKFCGANWLETLRFAFNKLKNKNDCKIVAMCVSGNGPTVVTDKGFTIRWDEETPFEYDFAQKDNPCVKFSLFLPKILHLKNCFPDEFKNSKFIFSGPEFVLYELTGNAVTILPEKRFETAYWTTESLSLCDIPVEKMPPFVEIGHCCGKLLDNQKEFLGLEENIPVFCGGPDFVMAIIGSGTNSVGDVVDRCGTSEGINICINKQIFVDGFRTLPSPFEDLWNISFLIPNSNKLSKEKRVEIAANGIKKIKIELEKNQITLSDTMVVSGGQANDDYLNRLKAKKMKIKIAKSNGCVHAELLGDFCAALKGMGKFDSILQASKKCIKKVIYEDS